jgi:hypothetical protein
MKINYMFIYKLRRKCLPVDNYKYGSNVNI